MKAVTCEGMAVLGDWDRHLQGDGGGLIQRIISLFIFFVGGSNKVWPGGMFFMIVMKTLTILPLGVVRINGRDMDKPGRRFLYYLHSIGWHLLKVALGGVLEEKY